MGFNEKDNQLQDDVLMDGESSTTLHIPEKKRSSRRVSFAAEMTSVHVFDRDDYSSTPPHSTEPPAEERQTILGLFRDLEDRNENDNEVADDDDIDGDESVDGSEGGRPFLRPVGSPSDGSIVGSATSNDDDEDDFFGPVSANFIRPGRLSDSAPSDDNHEITMDSTAFSMHFRSLARSDSGGQSTTSMGVQLDFEEKTPIQDSASSSMVLTGFERHFPPSSEHVSSGTDGQDFSDMSLVGENPHRYDYARLSPRLNELLSEGSKDVHVDYVSNSVLKSPRFTRIGSSASTMSGNGNPAKMELREMEPGNLCTDDVSGTVASVEVRSPHGVLSSSPVKLMTPTSNANNGTAAADIPVNSEIQTPQVTGGLLSDQRKKSVMESIESSFRATISNFNTGVHLMEQRVQNKLANWQSSEGLLEDTSLRDGTLMYSKLEEQSHNHHYQTPVAGSKSLLLKETLPENGLGVSRQNSNSDYSANNQDQSLLPGSISLLTPRQQKMLFGDANLSSYVNFERKSCSLVSGKHSKYGESLSVPRGILKSKLPSASPSGFTPKDGIGSSRSLSDHLPKLTSFRSVPSKSSKDLSWTHVDAPVVRLEERFSSLHVMKVKPEKSSNNESNDESLMIQNILHAEEPIDKSCIPMSAAITSCQSTFSGQEVPHDLLESESPIKEVPTTTEIKISQKQAVNVLKKHVSPRAQRSIVRLLASPDYIDRTLMDAKQQDQSHKLTGFSSEQDGDSMEIITNENHLATVTHYIDSLLIGNKAQPSTPLAKTESAKGFTHMRSSHNRNIDLQDGQSDCENNSNIQTHKRDFSSRNLFLSPGGYMETETNPTWSKETPLQKSQSQNDKIHPGLKSFSGRKRSKDMLQTDTSPGSNIEEIQRTPKIQKFGSAIKTHLELSTENIGDGNKTGHETAMKSWSDILAKFSADLDQLHITLIDKLNLGKVSELEDILISLQKVKSVEMLSSEIQSQQHSDRFRAIRQKRASEAKNLLYVLVYEKIKLQLNRLKQEKLLKRVELLRSGIQESQNLKFKCFDLDVNRTKASQVDNSSNQSLTVHTEDNSKVAHCKKTTMRQKAADSERKIKSLTNPFHTLLNIKEELSSVDTIELIKDYLKKRRCLRIMLQDLQFWKVDDFRHSNGQYSVAINYRGFILQRFVIAAPVSSIAVSNTLNDTCIVKKYPNLAACTAFSLVFKEVTSQKYVGACSLARETQETSALLSNLLDVMDEVQLAQLELRNLTETKFISPSVGQLELQLNFFNFKNGEKAYLTLDMNCLNRGVYPSEIIPSQVQIHHLLHSRKSQTTDLTVIAEIREAVEGLKFGYGRIIRLCRCVSQVLEALSR